LSEPRSVIWGTRVLGRGLRDVGGIHDRHLGGAINADVTDGVSRGGQPEWAYLLVGMHEMNAARPEGWNAGWTSLDAYDGIIVCVDPNSAVDQVLVFLLGGDLQHVCGTTIHDFFPGEFEVVVRWRDASRFSYIGTRCVSFFAQHPMQYQLADRVRTVFGDDGELLPHVARAAHLDEHFRAPLLVDDKVVAGRGITAELSFAPRIALNHGRDYGIGGWNGCSLLSVRKSNQQNCCRKGWNSEFDNSPQN